MAPAKSVRNILMELRKVCQHPYISAQELEPFDLPPEEQQKQLVNASSKLLFLKLLLPKLIAKGHRILLFSQFKLALDRIQDFLYGENIKHLRLDGDTQQAQRQKSMDLFNAPNSDYSVFLLTTRAGGVGINLATADTVILHDPDFNPHQDSQAIARAHRYGQKKKVLVFKLMVKGSVEETIINRSKSKMVLDHLVVQRINTTEPSEEPGFEQDLFVKGVESMYGGQNGIDVPDINYNSENVDELIDMVEKEADEEEKKTRERDEAIERGEIEPEIKKGAQFGFAKIWEADQNEVQDIQAGVLEKDGEEDEDVDWDQLLSAIQAEREARLQREMNAGRAKRKLKSQQGMYAAEDEEPESVKKKKKGRAKNVSLESSDAEYVAQSVTSENEDTGDDSKKFPLSLLNLASAQPGAVLGAATEKPKQKRKRKADQNGLPLISGPQDPSSSSGASTPNGFGAALPGRLPLPESQVKERNPLETVLKETRGAQGPDLQNEGPSARQSPATFISPADVIRAQNILQWLYSILRELASLALSTWALIGLRENPDHERMRAYIFLANEVDKRLVRFGGRAYFTQDHNAKVVERLIKSKWDIIPNLTAAGSGNINAVPVPVEARGDIRAGGGSKVPVSPPRHRHARTSSLPVSMSNHQTDGGKISTPHAETRPTPGALTIQNSGALPARPSVAAETEKPTESRPGAKPAPRISETRISEVIPAKTSILPAQQLHAAPKDAVPASIKPKSPSTNTYSTQSAVIAPGILGTSPTPPLAGSSTKASKRVSPPAKGLPTPPSPKASPTSKHPRQCDPIALEGSPEAVGCEFCQIRDHTLGECPRMLNKEKLEKFASAICRSKNTSLKDKNDHLESLQRMRDLLVRSGDVDPSFILPTPLAFAAHRSSSSSSLVHHNNSNRDKPVIAPSKIVDDNAEVEHKDTPIEEMGQILHLARKVSEVPGQRFGAEDGDTSTISNQISSTAPRTPSHDMTPRRLAFLEAATASNSMHPAVCPFCETMCGLALKECVKNKGSRKVLKSKIRALDDLIKDLRSSCSADRLGTKEQAGKMLELKMLKKVQTPLFDCYKSWPRE